MSLLLCIETATKNCSVALARNGETILCKEVADLGYSHAEKLHVFIDEILEEAGISYRDLSAVAVSRGPGSYTGLRIGVSAAKGLCFALDIPLISVDTLEVLASQAGVTHGLIIPMLDARRMEVYSAIFNHKIEKLRDTAAQIIDAGSFSELKETTYFVGDAQEKCKPFLQQSNFVFLGDVVYPTAAAMAALAFAKFSRKDVADVAYFEPFYLKDFLATTPKK
jgi:tRNA threonylcarbamoyladenosine biosynthesis protein TsaB